MVFRAVFDGSSLCWLMGALGRTALAEAADRPALLAALDQHAAAVRDAINSVGEPVGHGTLTRYLHGFLDGVQELGWRRPASGYDWETLRLAGICWLAREYRLVA